MRHVHLHIQHEHGPEEIIGLALSDDQSPRALVHLVNWIYTGGERDGVTAVACFNASADEGTGHWPLAIAGDWIEGRNYVPSGQSEPRSRPINMCPLEHEAHEGDHDHG